MNDTERFDLLEKRGVRIGSYTWGLNPKVTRWRAWLARSDELPKDQQHTYGPIEGDGTSAREAIDKLAVQLKAK